MESEVKPSYYAIIPAAVRYDDKLPANAKLLYGEITALCNKEGYCWATNKYFAELYSVHKNTVSDWIGKLVLANHITIKLIYNEGTREVKYRYIRLCGEGINEKVNSPIPIKTEDNNTSISTTVNTTSNTSNWLSKQNSEQFEHFWSVYPRKVGKAMARKAWLKMVLSEDISRAIATNIEQRVLLGEWSDVKFIPHPSTYLNQERWDDDLQASDQNNMPQKPKSERRLRDIPIEEQLSDTSWFTGDY